MANSQLEIRIGDMPDLYNSMVRNLADLLREAADSEGVPHTSKRLREIAAAFELATVKKEQ